MDELARKAGKDPVEFRRGMLGKVRGSRRRSIWSRRNPVGGSRCRHAPGRGVRLQPSFASFIATVVEAEVDEHGEVHLRRVTSAVDTGIAVNPDTIVAQLQGGLIFGLTAALYGEVTIEKGRVGNRISTITACCASTRCRRSMCTSSRAARSRAASARPA